MSFFGLGGGGIRVEIELDNHPERAGVVALDHPPGWKVRKNVFASLKYPPGKRGLSNPSAVTNGAASAITPVAPGSAAGGGGHGAVYAYEASEDVEGRVLLFLPQGKKADHLGIKVQFFGRIDMGMAIHEGRPHYDFISLSKELAPPGTLYQAKTVIPFHFRNVEKDHESYRGRNVSVRYFVRVVVERKFLPPIHKEHEVFVQIIGKEPAVNESIKMEVGIEDCLHIEFEYERRCYHLNDLILGKINFLLVRIKIKHMELAVIRRETSGEGVATTPIAPPGAAPGSALPAAGLHGNSADAGNILTETQTLTKYEIMDGAPVKGEQIPVRLYLKGIPADLTPTYDAVNNRFSVRYFLNLVLVDEEDRRYFKQQEIILWRKEIG
mmetsp:Transcript_12657/g.27405  ORF Transcript_12657/g.27405 Transcript_12657/m.27405 type:complete len:382 (-) Transcript_12657:135-1280(-)|eukprot:CAMPEP_0178483642 /NCGR_PEP_ID=MMETSP0696-20121128/7342_1 /TAXON_ID=265572 /ORGANISM="Extubocellulus spinifer, Strain CCMP396" /LENGTH=381 /DNA_ID=CAMNT_0020111171 /DNA_START=101 /DNA_END=1246 /DNA_ORIENTATION=-